MRTRSVIVGVIGQSNERGRRRQLNSDVSIQTGSLYGCPVADPIYPAASADAGGTPYGSWWPKVAEAMGRRGHWTHFVNYGLGATGWVINWCGTDNDLKDGTVQADGDPNFDPEGKLADTLAAIQIGNFDERWVFMSTGQKDSNDDVDLAHFQAATENIIQYFLNNGIKVACGFSLSKYDSAPPIAWYSDVGDPGWAAACSTYASNPNVIVGANLYRTLGVYPACDGGVHLQENAYPAATQAWIDALIAGGW